MMPADEDLTEWIRSVLARGCGRLELRQRDHSRVGEWSPPEGVEVEAASLALEVRQVAERDARYLGPRVPYVVLAYRRGETHFFARQFLEVEGAALATREAETPGLEAFAAQLMRHHEGTWRLSVGNTQELIKQYHRLFEQQKEHYETLLSSRDTRIRELEARELEISKILESVRAVDDERALERARLEQDQKRLDFFREKMDLFLPLVASKLLGKGSGPPPLGDEMIRQFMRSIRPEQMDQIMGALAPEQIAILAEVYQAYAAREAAREPHTNGVTTPESEAS